MKIVTVFTDGAAKGNGRKDAIGGIGIYFDGEPHLSHYEVVKTSTFKTKVTNNLTELYAIKKAIELTIKEYSSFILYLYTDSQYSYNIFTSWGKKWKENNWKKADGKPIINLDLIKSIYEYKENYKIIFHHCNSHKSPPPITSPEYKIWYGNDQADQLANRGISEL